METIAQEVQNPVATVRSTCRACESKDLADVLSLGNQYLVRFVKERDTNLPRAPLDLIQCSDCGLLQLRHTVDPDLLFREFWYRSSINQSMRDALMDLVEDGLKYHRRGTWLDIGANDGYLLSQVPNFRRIACEPAQNFADVLAEHSDLVVSDYFSAGIVDEECDVITSAAMFYDLDDPNKFIADVVSLLTHDGVWINQLNDAPTMLRSNAFDAIVHEHLCYYDLPTLERLYKKHGLIITNISHNKVNGGSVRVTARKKGPGVHPVDLFGLPPASRFEAWRFAQRVRKWKENMQTILPAMVKKGQIWGYGASTKGCVLLQYLDMSEFLLGIGDRNPAKKGLMMSGSWLPITDERTMRTAKPAYLVALPWAFREEFLKRERDLLDQGSSFLFPLPDIELVS